MASSAPGSWRQLFRQHLSTARVSVIRQVLESHSSQLAINTGSQMLFSNVDTANELIQWQLDRESEAPKNIIITQETAETQLSDELERLAKLESLDSLPEVSITHAIMHVQRAFSEEDIGLVLRKLYDVLQPGGTLVVSRRKRDAVANSLEATGVPVPGRIADARARLATSDELARMVEGAGFDRDNMYRIEKSHLLKGERLSNFASDLEAALEASLGACPSHLGWKGAYESSLEAEVRTNGGLLLETFVVIASK